MSLHLSVGLDACPRQIGAATRTTRTRSGRGRFAEIITSTPNRPQRESVSGHPIHSRAWARQWKSGAVCADPGAPDRRFRPSQVSRQPRSNTFEPNAVGASGLTALCPLETTESAARDGRPDLGYAPTQSHSRSRVADPVCVQWLVGPPRREETAEHHRSVAVRSEAAGPQTSRN